MAIATIFETIRAGIPGRLRRRRKPPSPFPHMDVIDSLRPDDVAIDCGANVGEVTQRIADRGAMVHAFEPNPDAFAVLERRFRRSSRVTCHRAAVHTADGKLRLYRHHRAGENPVTWSQGASIRADKPNVNPDDWVEVDAVDLGHFILALNRPVTLMKMDIEGAEVAVLPHLVRTGALDRIGTVLVETHERKFPALAEETKALRRLLRDRGYDNVRLDWL